MAKTKTVFFCTECGHEMAKWVGKCPSCNQWNTYKEAKFEKSPKGRPDKSVHSFDTKPVLLQDVESGDYQRTEMPDNELNRVLGGGVVPGSLVLLGGEPGIGKSTLMLQNAIQSQFTIAYVSGEESQQQIKMRAERVGIKNDNCYLITETSTEKILKYFRQLKPDLCVLDSIQTLQSPYADATAGSIVQIRECAGELQRYAKESGVPVFIIGHINKDGYIAGPKILEHIVDTVLQFEGDRHYSYRLLRTLKNRFGSTDEIGIYEMNQEGLRQVHNPSELLISQDNHLLSGVSISATVEGMRPLMIETQALVSRAVYGTPQRSTTGFDVRRLHMLIAVLEKRCGFQLGDKDIFINIAGGLKVADPAIDLSIVASLLSSYEDHALGSGIAFAGEVGLSGEVRVVNRIEQRIAEAEKLGFKQLVIANKYKNLKQGNFKIQLTQVSTVVDLYRQLF